jgi:hypothetical protein
MSIERARLQDIMKEHIPEMGHKWFVLEPADIMQEYLPFFLALAKETDRVNSSSVASVAKALFGASKNEAQKFGDSMSRALAYCKKAGDKSTTGEKLPEAVRLVYISMKSAKLEPQSAKMEPNVKLEKEREAYSPPPGAKKVKAERGLHPVISSPSQVMRLYKIGAVKAEPGEVTGEQHVDHMLPSLKKHIYIYIYSHKFMHLHIWRE